MRLGLLTGGLLALGLATALLLLRLDGQGAAGTDESRPLPQLAPFEDANEAAAVIDLVALPETGDMAPDFVLKDREGNDVRLSDLRGRPVILNFWATWCAPCRLEMPELAAAQRQYEIADLAVLAVNQQESALQVDAFFNELDLGLTALLDPDGDVGALYGAHFLPMTIFISPDGEIRAIHRGIISRSQIDQYMLNTLPLES